MDNVISKLKRFLFKNKALLLVLVLGLLFRSYEITESFVGHHDLMGAQLGVVERNHLRYGFLETKFGAVTNVIDGKLIYYSNYPQFGVILLSLFHMILGVNEWTIRLPYILFGLANIILLYAIVSKIWDKNTALISTIFLAVVPEAVYFDRFGFPIGLFFQFLFIYLFIKWIEDNEKKYFYYLILITLFGGLDSHYFLPFVFLFFLVSILFRSKVNIKLFSLIPIVAFIAFLINMLHINLLSGNVAHLSSAVDKYLGLELLLSPSFYRVFLDRFMSQVGFIVLTLSFIWFWNALTKKFEFDDKEKLFKNSIILILFAYGLMFFVLMPGAVYEHDYFLYSLVPPFIISAALGLQMLPKNVHFPILVLFVIFSVYGVIGMHGNSAYHGEIRDVARYINVVSNPDDLVLATTFEREDFLKYYSDRSVLVTINLTEFNEILVENKPPIVLLSDFEFDEVQQAEDLLLEKDYYQLNDSRIPEGMYVWKKRD
ncbi:MAG: glycosyltransferase family 39 protein [Candidatus Altiarchaeota archaeon]|nr:glycosyltransferase family 39 protein [Candidatus Altiarchaeota archaeon]